MLTETRMVYGSFTFQSMGPMRANYALPMPKFRLCFMHFQLPSIVLINSHFLEMTMLISKTIIEYLFLLVRLES